MKQNMKNMLIVAVGAVFALGDVAFGAAAEKSGVSKELEDKVQTR